MSVWKHPHEAMEVVTAALAIAGVTAREAVRGRLVWLVAGFTVAGCAFALLAGQLALTEAQGVRAGLLGAWLRACAVFTVGAFVVTSAVRELQDKRLEMILSMPVSRGTYCAGKLGGFAGVSMLSAAACAPALLWFAPPAQVALWVSSLGLELLVVAATSLLCVFTFSQPTTALGAVAGFYVLSRAVAALQLMAHEPLAGPESIGRWFMRTFLDGLAFVLPDLDRFTESQWLIHGAGTIADLGFAAAQTAVYVALLAAAASFDLHRKAL